VLPVAPGYLVGVRGWRPVRQLVVFQGMKKVLFTHVLGVWVDDARRVTHWARGICF
jgi:hypothetical protein